MPFLGLLNASGELDSKLCLGYCRIDLSYAKWMMSPPDDDNDLAVFVNISKIEFRKPGNDWGEITGVGYFHEPDSGEPFATMPAEISIPTRKQTVVLDPGKLRLIMSGVENDRSGTAIDVT